MRAVLIPKLIAGIISLLVTVLLIGFAKLANHLGFGHFIKNSEQKQEREYAPQFVEDMNFYGESSSVLGKHGSREYIRTEIGRY